MKTLKGFTSGLGFLFALAAVLFILSDIKVGWIACLGILILWAIFQALFNFFVGCFTLKSLVQTLREARDSSMPEWDDLLED